MPASSLHRRVGILPVLMSFRHVRFEKILRRTSHAARKAQLLALQAESDAREEAEAEVLCPPAIHMRADDSFRERVFATFASRPQPSPEEPAASDLSSHEFYAFRLPAAEAAQVFSHMELARRA